MAKQAEETTKAGKGKKPCPQCGEVLGARAAKCKCGYEFPKKQAKTSTNGKPSAKERLKDAIELVKVCGSVEEAEKMLEVLTKIDG